MIIEIKDIPANQIIKTIDVHIDFLKSDGVQTQESKYNVVYDDNVHKQDDNRISTHTTDRTALDVPDEMLNGEF